MQAILELFNPLVLAMVWLGAIAVVGLQEGSAGLIRSFTAWNVLLRADPVRDAQMARQSLHQVEAVIDGKGLHCVDQVNAKSGFVARAAAHLASDQDIYAFSRWAGSDLNEREARHNSVIRFWIAVADVAPAIGMAGTIIGLVRMFKDLNDPANLGSAMALALLTTFYGLVLSNLIAAPISQRFLRLSTEELKWQRILTDRLIVLARQSHKQNERRRGKPGCV